MVLVSALGMDAAAIAKVAFTSGDRVRDMIRNFNADGFSLRSRGTGAGRAPKFTLPQRREIKKIVKSRPVEQDLPVSPGACRSWRSSWWLRGVVDDISHEALRVLLREEGVTFQLPGRPAAAQAHGGAEPSDTSLGAPAPLDPPGERAPSIPVHQRKGD
jgi:transposase